MASRRPAVRLSGIAAAIVALASLAPAAATAAAPTLLSAVSRMTHGSAGAFDVQLPLTGGSGVECRSIAGGTTLVLTFDQPVKAATAGVSAGVATLGAPTFSTNTVLIPVSGLTDAEAVAVRLSNVANAAGESLASQDVSFRTLFGDLNGSGSLSTSDVNLVRAAVANANPINGATFRCDVNLSGTFTNSDVTPVRSAVANSAFVDGGPTNNTPPTLTAVASQSVVTGTPMSPVGFTVADAESDPSTLVVTWTTSDQITIPNGNVSISGTGASRQVTLTPAAGVTTTVPVTVTLSVSDGLAYSAPMSFTANVTPPPITYLATLKPVDGTGSLASGTALLTVSGDRTYGTLNYSYSNLSSADTDDTVNDGSGGVMYDVPVGKARGDQQVDGSYKWVFATAKQPDILAALASNTSTFLVDTAGFPAGELVGTFRPINGSQTFTPPAAPPAFQLNPPTAADASRFLQQAGFGGTSAEVGALSDPNAANAATAINDWLAAQSATPVPIYPTYAAVRTAPPTTAPTTQPMAQQTLGAQSASQPYSTSSLYWYNWQRICTPQGANAYGDGLSSDRCNEGWWRNAVTAPDPLRQRVATALMEIFVTSQADGTIDANSPSFCTYYDMLAGDAFGNFRTLLADVTLHPMMGVYLNMMGSTKASPNENYCREILQLFSVGLYMLQPDGTLMLDSAGRPIPTYDQSQITSMAQVFTGWDYDSSRIVSINVLNAPAAGSTTPTVVSTAVKYAQPMTITSANATARHSLGAKTLLSYPGVATIPPATVPATIAATTGTSTTVATNELNATLDNIFNHPNVGPFICRQLIQRLVCSNPSPAYVYRVAQAFNNNGSGVRGDMKAVVTAILTDYEARSPAVQANVGYGKMREPVVKVATLLHALAARSADDRWAIGRTDGVLAQTMFRSPTVFNFFDPAYAQPGPVQQAGLASPEFNVIYATTIVNAANMFYTGLYTAGYNADGSPKYTSTGFKGDNFGTDVYLDFSDAGNGLLTLCQTAGTDAMLDRVILLLNAGPLDATGNARGRILTFLGTLPSTGYLARCQAAVYLVATAAQASVQK